MLLLRPLDTHVFGPVKQVLRDLYRQEQVRASVSALVASQWVAAIVATMQRVLAGRDWGGAVAANGFAFARNLLSARALTALG